MEYPIDPNNPYDLLYQKIEKSNQTATQQQNDKLIDEASELLDAAENIKIHYKEIVP